MDDNYTPVVKARPERGREIKSAKMPTEKLIESLKDVSGQTAPSSEQDVTYHEGYVDGKKYLVPDSTLDAMKDMINIVMRPRQSLRYKNQTSLEISDYDHFKDKLAGLLDKMDKFDISSESSEELSASPESVETDESRETRLDSKDDSESKRSEASSMISNVSKQASVDTLKSGVFKSLEEETSELNITENTEVYEGEETRQQSNIYEKKEDDTLSLTDKVQPNMTPPHVEKQEDWFKTSNYKKEETEERSPTEASLRLSEEVDKPLKFQMPLPVTSKLIKHTVTTKEPSPTNEDCASFEPKECHIRLLISGHFKDDRPLFLIQEYNTKSDIFKNQKTDFIDSKRNGNIELSISGKFYKNNILEELNGEPISYNILPDKIVINKEKIKVYINSFSDDFYWERVVLNVRGEFLMHDVSNMLTPLLSFNVEPNIPEFGTLNKDYTPYGNDVPTMVLIYTPTYINPFAHYDDKIINNKEASSAVLARDSYYPNPSSYVNGNDIESNHSIGPVSLHLDNSANSFSSLLMHSMIKSNLQVVNHSTPSAGPRVQIGYKPKINPLYSKKQLNRNRNRHKNAVSPHESTNGKEAMLEEPKLSSYCYADDKGEYYSTYKDDSLNYTKQNDSKQLDSSHKLIKNKLILRKPPIEKDCSKEKHETNSDRVKNLGSNVPEPKSYYYADENGEYFFSHRDDIHTKL